MTIEPDVSQCRRDLMGNVALEAHTLANEFADAARAIPESPYGLLATISSRTILDTPMRTLSAAHLPTLETDSVDLTLLGGSALRGFAVGFEIAAHMFGWRLERFHDWERKADDVILKAE